MLVTKSRNLAKRAKYYRSHGMSALTLDRHKGRAISYDVVLSGLNYRIDEMRASLGIVQLEKLEEGNRSRKVLVERYINNLKDVEEITIPFQDLKDSTSSYHIFVILLSREVDREKLILKLKDAGIQSSIHYPAFKDFTALEILV